METDLDPAQITPPAPAGKPDNSGPKELLLAQLRVGATHARLAANELDLVGTSLREEIITATAAVAWLRDEGLDSWIASGPGAPS